jgi:hypothetical protein
MNQDKAIFMSKCSALTPKNNEILVYILPFKSAYYLFHIPYALLVVSCKYKKPNDYNRLAFIEYVPLVVLYFLKVLTIFLEQIFGVFEETAMQI